VSAGAIASLAAGIAILLLAARDIFATVLHHWSGAGPLSGRMAHWTWSLTVRLSRGMRSGRRRRLLGWVGPMMIPLIVAFWAVLTILGFSFLYYPWIVTGFAPDTGAPHPTGFGDALYFSGVSFFTIGYGDLVPVTGAMRFVGVLEGGSGFALVTLTISYFASLYVGYVQQKTTAQSVHFQAQMCADASRIVENHLVGGQSHSLAHEVARLRDGMAAIRADYTNYPILHYFIASRPEDSLVRLLFVVQDLRLLLDTLLDPERIPSSAGTGERSGLLHATAAVQAGIATTLLRRPFPGTVDAPSADAQARWRERFGEARRRMADSGIAVRSGPDAVEEYCRQRYEWEPPLRACAEALGEEWAEVTDGY
jgi:hypothetical protein